MRFGFCAMGSASHVGETFISSLHRVFSFFVFSFFLSFIYIVLLDLAPPFALIFFGGGGSWRKQGKSAAPERGPAAWWMWLVS